MKWSPSRSVSVRNRRIQQAVTTAMEALDQRIVFNSTYANLGVHPLVQDWTTTDFVSANDDWSSVPSIEGFRGDGLSSPTGGDPRNVLNSNTAGDPTPGNVAPVIDVNANLPNPDAFGTGGVAEFDTLSNPVVAFQGSGTAQAPYLKFYVDTTGASQVHVHYMLRDIDGATNVVSQVALQYRVGETGNFTSIQAAYVSDASGNGTTQTNTIDVDLPADALNQPKVQIRVVTCDAVGTDEFIGVDDIIISSGPTAQPQAAFSLLNSSVFENEGSKQITVYRSGDTSAQATVNYATIAGGTATPNPGGDYNAASGQITFQPGETTATFSINITEDPTVEPNETIKIQLSNYSIGQLNDPSITTLTILDNDTPAPTGVFLNEINTNPPGTDNPFEYIEIKGAPGQVLTNVYVASVEGDTGSNIGSVTAAFNLGSFTIGTNGLLLIKAPTNTTYETAAAAAGTTIDNDAALNAAALQDGTNSILLVYSLVPITSGSDLSSDDTSLTLPANASLLDGIGMNDGGVGDVVIGAPTLTQSTGIPDAYTRIVGTTTTDTAASWYGADLLSTGTVQDQRKYDTFRASSNIPRAAIVTPGLPNFVGDGSTQGEIGFIQDNFNVSEFGPSPTITVVRGAGSTGAVSAHYTMTAGTATAGDDFVITDGVLNFADGETTKTFTLNITNDAAVENAETINLALDTPTGGATIGVRSTATATIVKNDATLVLNEILVNPAGNDGPFEYIELKGTPGMSLAGIYFVSVEGDSTAQGVADLVVDLSSFSLGNNGLLVILAADNAANPTPYTPDPNTTVVTSSALNPTAGFLENGSNSWLVISSPTNAIVQTTDYDLTTSGTLTLPSGATILDGVGFLDGDNGNDLVYGSGALLSNTTPALAAATRYLGNNDPLFSGAWYFGTVTGPGATPPLVYNAGTSSANLPTGAAMTPGAPNTVVVPDTTPPTVTGAFEYDAAHQRVTLSFSEPVPNFAADDLQITQTVPSGSGDVPAANIVLTPTTGNNYEVTFVNYPNNALPDGRYHFVVHKEGVADAANNTLAADFTVDFFVLSADANHDNKVNALDFNAVATNFGSAGTFSKGDFNYNGTVNAQDFTILGQQFGKTVPLSAPPVLGSLFSDKPVKNNDLIGVI